jgi:predicted DNA-binding transcriptional regulator YafY
VLRPYFLEPAAEGRHIYVFAHDEQSAEVRPFRLERILNARLLTQTFAVPDGFDIDRVIRASWGVWQGDTEDEVLLRFSPEARRFLAETRWHPSASLSERPDGSTEVRMRVVSEVEMRPWVLRWGAMVEVLAPASLRAFVADSVRRAAAQYAAAGTPAQ